MSRSLPPGSLQRSQRGSGRYIHVLWKSPELLFQGPMSGKAVPFLPGCLAPSTQDQDSSLLQVFVKWVSLLPRAITGVSAPGCCGAASPSAPAHTDGVALSSKTKTRTRHPNPLILHPSNKHTLKIASEKSPKQHTEAA